MISIGQKVNNIVADCNLYLNGLEAGTYYLVETKAPDGYNKVSGPIKVIIKQSTDDNEANWTLTAHHSYIYRWNRNDHFLNNCRSFDLRSCRKLYQRSKKRSIE